MASGWLSGGLQRTIALHGRATAAPKQRQRRLVDKARSKKARRPGVQVCRLWAGLGERCLLRRDLPPKSDASEARHGRGITLEIEGSPILSPPAFILSQASSTSPQAASRSATCPLSDPERSR